MSSTAFEILAAIDLRGGRVVRLVEGDFERETTYSEEPLGTADDLAAQGSHWLHVVDLDGARAGRPVQADLATSIADSVRGRSRVEVGGGIRTLDSAAAYLAAGIDRVVIGTAALHGPLARDIVAAFGTERVAVAIDVRGGNVVGSGWAGDASAAPFEATMETQLGEGIQIFEVTAIERDGTLTGPDLGLLERAIRAAAGARVIASAGIRSIDDLRAVRRLGCAGAIVGRAIYEGTIVLSEATLRSM